jgi:acetyltransferase-like isoleucine patch superfamily enzyme
MFTFNPFNIVRNNSKNQIILDSWCYLNRIKIRGYNNKIIIKNSTFKLNKIEISGNNNILVIDGARIITNSSFIIKDNNNSISIGKNTGISKSRIVCCGNNEKIDIGDDCMFADGVEIWNCDTHSIIEKDSRKRLNFAGSIIIENHIWLCRGVNILKNVTIHENTVIGVNSIVTKGMYDRNSLYVGIPAKKVKNNIDWDMERL